MPTEPTPSREAPARVVPLEARTIALVLLGGVIGAAGREGLSLAMPAAGGIPWSVFVVNVVGAALLGCLLTVLVSRRRQTQTHRDIRLFAGTGVLGGFTTYSSLATDTALLLDSRPGTAIAYAVASVLFGVVAAGVGIRIGTVLSRTRGGHA